MQLNDVDSFLVGDTCRHSDTAMEGVSSAATNTNSITHIVTTKPAEVICSPVMEVRAREQYLV
jgi:hypothetical protein